MRLHGGLPFDNNVITVPQVEREPRNGAEWGERDDEMAEFMHVHQEKWRAAQTVGHTLERCGLWEGREGTAAELWRIPEDYDLGKHRHDTWVSVFILEGAMRYTDSAGERTLGPGDCYFVNPGDTHREETLAKSLVLVVEADPCVSYPVDENGQRTNGQ
ncbi:cupin domain-containing protein [Streptomyces malaysiensis]|uniref:Cupin domain-containing protein n=1 Tax=Streptomyces malaysiensis subsp. samsunensis TaxID=459658 RepID=A0A9X2LUZ3_STRMQ|nr:cupin domain-containing protein [Streptomyces samsunensis]MCQ8829973.1 cupin domain-containing protein [Streptomyces samsunensis]